jgi:actin related protein 2/3 complex subunit 1A/1B
VAFHPKNGQILAAGGTDFKCRVFSTYSADVDGGEVSDVKSAPFTSPVEFGEVYCEFGALGWINACAWSPSGNILCYAGHDSSVHFVDLSSGPNHAPQSIRFPDMPLSCLLFTSEHYLLGGGHDFNPVVYTNQGGVWCFRRRLDEKKAAAATSSSGVGAARALFQNKTRTGQDAKAEGDTLWTQHENVITCMSRGKHDSVASSSLDGKIVVWDSNSLSAAMDGLTM